MSPTGNREQFNLQFSCLLGSWVLASAELSDAPENSRTQRRWAECWVNIADEQPPSRSSRLEVRKEKTPKLIPKSRLSLSQSPRQRKQPWILWRPILLPDFNLWRKNPMRMLGAKRRHVDFDLCRSWLYCVVFESLPSLGGLSSQLFKTGGNLPESKLKRMLKTQSDGADPNHIWFTYFKSRL